MNALKENRIQVFRLAFTCGPAVTVTLVTRPVVPVCRHLTAEWLPRLSGAQSPSRLISSGVRFFSGRLKSRGVHRIFLRGGGSG